jgi:nicotinate-nucleotide adenylyltransferase
LRIGLFGGSFNPPHAGHIHASDIALKYLGLDAVWWLVSPGNPLKSKVGLPDAAVRIQHCQNIIKNPRVIVTDLETRLGTRRSFDTVQALQHHYPHTEFIWFSGTDIAYEFHKWHKWRQLTKIIPFAFVGRPTAHGVVRQNVFRRSSHLSHSYLTHGGVRSPLEKGRVYWIFAEPLLDISSTQLRGKTDDICLMPQKGLE